MELQPYDILFYKKGNSIVSKAIKYITKSKYSHIAMYLRNGQIVETDYKKTFNIGRLGNISDYDVYRIETLTGEQKVNIIRYIKNNLYKKYDYLEILRYLIYKYFGILLCDDMDRLICSEAVFECLLESEILKMGDIKQEEQRVLSPQDLLDLLKNQLGDSFREII